MKPQFLFIFLLNLFVGGVISAGPLQATGVTAPERVLAYALCPTNRKPGRKRRLFTPKSMAVPDPALIIGADLWVAILPATERYKLYLPGLLRE